MQKALFIITRLRLAQIGLNQVWKLQLGATIYKTAVSQKLRLSDRVWHRWEGWGLKSGKTKIFNPTPKLVAR